MTDVIVYRRLSNLVGAHSPSAHTAPCAASSKRLFSAALLLILFGAHCAFANPFVSPASKTPKETQSTPIPAESPTPQVQPDSLSSSAAEKPAAHSISPAFPSEPEAADTGAVSAHDGKDRHVLPVRTSAPDKNLVKQQGYLRGQLAQFLYQLKKNTADGQSRKNAAAAVVFFAFLYGILHAAGPGHRKTIVFSMYIVRKAPVWEPAAVGFTISMLHGFCAVILLLAFRGVSGSISSHTDSYTMYLEGFSYVLLIVTACALIIHETRLYFKTRRTLNSSRTDCTSTTAETAHTAKNDRTFAVCAHTSNPAHTPRSARSISLASFIISGIYPCPGAILVLVLAHTLNIVGAGILAVTAMSVGMSVPIIISAYLGYFGRSGLFKLASDNKQKALIVSYAAEMTGLVFMLCVAVYTASPFIISLIRL